MSCPVSPAESTIPTGKMNPFNNQPYTPNYWTLFEKRQKLPVWNHKDEFLTMLDNNQFMILTGGQGSGKTTQIPQWCAEWSLNQARETGMPGIVAVTEPKRLAAIAGATRSAEEMDVQLGEEVGYTIRFEDRTSEKTVLKYCTDGMLLRETLNNPELKGYFAIILDEAQERSIGTDILLALLKKLVKQRPDLKTVIISSTKLNSEKFQKFFNDCPTLSITGTSTPVEPDQIVPAIQKSDLRSVVLQLKKMGIDLAQSDFVDPITPETPKSAEELLFYLEAIDDQGKLTKIGSLMAEFPLDPQMSKMLITSIKLNCSNDILSIIAMNSVPPCFVRPDDAKEAADEAKARFTNPKDDNLTLLSVYQAYKESSKDLKWCQQNYIDYKTMQMADTVRGQLALIMDKLNLELISTKWDYDDNMERALALGFPKKHSDMDAKDQVSA